MLLPSPRSVSAAEGAQAAADGRVVIYFRKHCLFCERLRTMLGRDRRKAVWADIWADPDAAAYVRSVNGGDETVPTVVIGGTPHTNPAPAMVKRALQTP